MSSLKKQKYTYIIEKLKYIFNNNNIIMSIQCSNLSTVELNSIKKELEKSSNAVHTYYVKNRLAKILLQNTKLKLFPDLLNSSTLLVYTNDLEINTQVISRILEKNKDNLSLIGGKLTKDGQTILLNSKNLTNLFNYGFDTGLYYVILSTLQQPSFSVYQRVKQYSTLLNE